jgi:hypothetical protein
MTRRYFETKIALDQVALALEDNGCKRKYSAPGDLDADDGAVGNGVGLEGDLKASLTPEVLNSLLRGVWMNLR